MFETLRSLFSATILVQQILMTFHVACRSFSGGFFKNTWKKRYFVLYQSGDFCYYQDPHDKEVDGKINMKTQCRHIAVGHAVGEGVKAPKDVDAMFSVVSTERTFYLVADSASEARLVFRFYYVSINDRLMAKYQTKISRSSQT